MSHWKPITVVIKAVKQSLHVKMENFNNQLNHAQAEEGRSNSSPTEVK